MQSKPATYPEKINCILYWCEVMCHLCGERIMPGEFHADHHPFAKWQGAGNNPDEMKPAHAECNRRKGTKREARDARKTKRLERERMGEPKRKRRSRPIPQPADPWGKKWKEKIKEQAQ